MTNNIPTLNYMPPVPDGITCLYSTAESAARSDVPAAGSQPFSQNNSNAHVSCRSQLLMSCRSAGELKAL